MKMHLNLATRDLDASVAYYRTLFVAEPMKQYADYALFVTEDPGLELALDLDPAASAKHSDHFGVVVESAEAVDAAIARLEKAGYAVDIEKEETCCYAVQNKVWSTDPDGRRWETYHVVAEVAERGDEADAEGSSCCGTDDDVVAA